MVRYHLSKIFSAVVHQAFSGKRLRDVSREVYQENILEGIKTLLTAKNDSWKMEIDAENSSFTLMSDVFPIAQPLKFTCDTEWSDFLQLTGREAAIRMTQDGGKSHIFYYGNTLSPDNNASTYNRLSNQWDLEKMTDCLRGLYYDIRHAEEDLCRSKSNNLKASHLHN